MHVQKRINKELNSKISNYFDFKLPYHLVISKYEPFPIEFNLINEQNYKVEMTIIISNQYPFKAPSIHLSPETIKKFSLIHRDKRKLPLSKSYLSWNGELFKPAPIIDIYLAWLFTIIRYPKMSRFWDKIPKIENCLCCESFTCPENWSPGIKLYDLVSEYLLRKRFYFYTTKLMQKNLTSTLLLLFNNDRWKMNDDIILHILRFCHQRNYQIDHIILEILNRTIS